MHCEGCGFCLHTLECPVRGRAHPSTDKWLFQKWCQEVDVEEVLTATLPNEPVSGDEELDVLSNPLLASPPGKEVKKKEVQSSDSEVDLFAPPPTAPVPKKKAKGKKVLPKAPPIDPPNPQRRTRSTIPSETTPLGVGDWLTDKDILCWLNQEVCHNEIDEPRAWTLAVIYMRNRQLYILRMYCKGWISFNFSIFFIIYTTYSKKKKLHDLPQKLKNSIFFYNSHDLQQKKKITRIYSIKKKLHDYTVFLYTTYIFHLRQLRPGHWWGTPKY